MSPGLCGPGGGPLRDTPCGQMFGLNAHAVIVWPAAVPAPGSNAVGLCQTADEYVRPQHEAVWHAHRPFAPTIVCRNGPGIRRCEATMWLKKCPSHGNWGHCRSCQKPSTWCRPGPSRPQTSVPVDRTWLVAGRLACFLGWRRLTVWLPRSSLPVIHPVSRRE